MLPGLPLLPWLLPMQPSDCRPLSTDVPWRLSSRLTLFEELPLAVSLLLQLPSLGCCSATTRSQYLKEWEGTKPEQEERALGGPDGVSQLLLLLSRASKPQLLPPLLPLARCGMTCDSLRLLRQGLCVPARSSNCTLRALANLGPTGQPRSIAAGSSGTAPSVRGWGSTEEHEERRMEGRGARKPMCKPPLPLLPSLLRPAPSHSSPRPQRA